VAGFILTEEAHGRIPWCVSAMQAPSPVSSEGQQCPSGFAEGSSKVGGGCIHGDHQISLADNSGGVGKVANRIPQIMYV
ncbi:uncharacterized protein METZ01_LOCUS308222, partial [marine metagenome]